MFPKNYLQNNFFNQIIKVNFNKTIDQIQYQLKKNQYKLFFPKN